MKRVLKQLYRALPLKQQVFSGLKRVWQPSESFFKHLHFHGDFTVAVDATHSFRMRHYGYFLENEIFWNGLEHGHEPVSYGLWKKLAARSQVILDIGANTGVYSLIAKSLNPGAKVFAFEPVKRVFEKLEINRQLNGYDFVSFELALSDHDGEAVIYDTDAEHTYSVTVNQDTTPVGANVIETKIRIERLDTFIEREHLERIDLMKIDVEAHEPEVLSGMGNYLERYKPTILIEILNDEIGERVERLVEDHGYLYFNIDDHAGTLRQVEHIGKSDFWNYLLCDATTAKELG
jgi:FkbM family methyltransferase